MSEIVIDKAEYGLEGCKVGDPYVVRATATAVDGEQVTLEVNEVMPDEEEEAQESPMPAKSGNPVSKIGIPSAKAAYA